MRATLAGEEVGRVTVGVPLGGATFSREVADLDADAGEPDRGGRIARQGELQRKLTGSVASANCRCAYEEDASERGRRMGDYTESSQQTHPKSTLCCTLCGDGSPHGCPVRR